MARFPRDSTGIIPARAGFTSEPPAPRRPGEDHPRSRGVYSPARRTSRSSAGSSPLARGLRSPQGRRLHRQWIIPARAGFTAGSRGPGFWSPDHPRSRGVYPVEITDLISGQGSSPLARGLPDLPEEARVTRRIIPARAGFTATARSRAPSTWDHPRSRGVYIFGTLVGARFYGSSPLARGLRVGERLDDDTVRIIPARAGFTRPGWPGRRVSRDHPRSRGVYPPSRGPVVLECGSSPLARGLRPKYLRAGHDDGIIPARAGFTGRFDPVPDGLEDHPRSRGVYVLI